MANQINKFEELIIHAKKIIDILAPKNNLCPIPKCNKFSYGILCFDHNKDRSVIKSIIDKEHKNINKLLRHLNMDASELCYIISANYETIWPEIIVGKDILDSKNCNRIQNDFNDTIIYYMCQKFEYDFLYFYKKISQQIKIECNKIFNKLDDSMFDISIYGNDYEYLSQNKNDILFYLQNYDYKEKNNYHTISSKDAIEQFKYIFDNLYLKIKNPQSPHKFLRNVVEYFTDSNNDVSFIEDREYYKEIQENYNENLYDEMFKIRQKYKNIIFIEREKTFSNLRRVKKLRYDLSGILINESNTQIYYFIIELDDDSHFSDNNTKNNDIIKEIYAIYNSYSILRVTTSDNIYENIDIFINKIMTEQKPIAMYSNPQKYKNRLMNMGNNNSKARTEPKSINKTEPKPVKSTKQNKKNKGIYVDISI